MNVHLFGAVSSPGVANFGLGMTAEAGRQQFGPEAANFLRDDFCKRHQGYQENSSYVRNRQCALTQVCQ